MFKNIIWDFDGTLFDTYPGMVRAFKLALVDEGIEEDETKILDYMKRSAMEAIEHYRNSYNLSDSFISNMKRYDKEVGLHMAVSFPFAEEICRWAVENGRKNYILTHRGYTTHKLLQKYRMEQYFIEIVTKHSGFKRKPDPEGYAYLINKYGMKKEETIIVGDRELEIMAGKALGVKVCLYDTNKIEFCEKPDFIIASLEEVKRICSKSH